uniref:DNA mismatch repair proteins mutS family domain-containing protein n=1 Tax=Globisporangium ultimum (strain ATCC 200006 / CBS 805.95 / DAOM BR144) TaxID=431595 RepID=K3WCK8_GLOUD
MSYGSSQFLYVDLLTNALGDIVTAKLALVLRHQFNTTDAFLKVFIDEVGPLFIILDEIGMAFENDNLTNIATKDLFMEFCYKFLGKWLVASKE